MNSNLLKACLALDYLPRGARLALAEIATLARKTNGTLELSREAGDEVAALGKLIGDVDDALPLFEPQGENPPLLGFHDGERMFVIVNCWQALRVNRFTSRRGSDGRVGESTSAARMRRKRERDRASVTLPSSDASHLTKSDGVTSSVTRQNVTASHRASHPPSHAVTPNEQVEKHSVSFERHSVTSSVTPLATAEPSHARASEHRCNELRKENINLGVNYSLEVSSARESAAVHEAKTLDAKQEVGFSSAPTFSNEELSVLADGMRRRAEAEAMEAGKRAAERRAAERRAAAAAREAIAQAEHAAASPTRRETENEPVSETRPATRAKADSVAPVGNDEIERDYRHEIAAIIEKLEFFDPKRDSAMGLATGLSSIARRHKAHPFRCFEQAVCDYRKSKKARAGDIGNPHGFLRTCFENACCESVGMPRPRRGRAA